MPSSFFHSCPHGIMENSCQSPRRCRRVEAQAQAMQQQHLHPARLADLLKGSVEEKVTRKVMLLLGCGISSLSFSSPVIIYWSLGSSLPETITFHSLWDLIATAASCLAWLLFGITQLRIEGNRVFGAEAVVVNLLGIIVYTLCTIIKMAGDANVRIKPLSLCVVPLSSFCTSSCLGP